MFKVSQCKLFTQSVQMSVIILPLVTIPTHNQTLCTWQELTASSSDTSVLPSRFNLHGAVLTTSFLTRTHNNEDPKT